MKAFCPSIVSSKSNRKLVQRVGQASQWVVLITTLQRIHYWVDENSFTMNGGGYVGGFFIGVHMPHESHAPAVSVDVQVQPQTVLVTAINIVAKDGYSINADWAATSVAMARNGMPYVRAYWSVIIICVRTACAMGEPLKPELWTTSFRKLMVARMQTVTCRVCAGPVIKQKQRANASIDNSSHL